VSVYVQRNQSRVVDDLASELGGLSWLHDVH